jgi:aspartate 1-decarboxylase
VTVKQADLNSVGSITVDETLLEARGVEEYQYVDITNLSNAAFSRTRVMAGKKGSGIILLDFFSTATRSSTSPKRGSTARYSRRRI